MTMYEKPHCIRCMRIVKIAKISYFLKTAKVFLDIKYFFHEHVVYQLNFMIKSIFLRIMLGFQQN